MKIALLLLLAVAAAAVGIYVSGAFGSKSTATTPRLVAPPPTRHIHVELPAGSVRPGDELDLSGAHVSCLVGRANGIFIECAPTESTGAFRPGSYGAVIRDNAAIVCRLVQRRCAHSAGRSQPHADTLVAVPVPRRRANTFAAAPGSVIPVGGTSVICDVERAGGVRTLFCGLARNVVGSARSVDVVYLASSFGIRISAAEAAIVRWMPDGSTATVASRAQPR
jgi:hypothetical protein